jgi:MYXO-CTERM domain-containing protein
MLRAPYRTLDSSPLSLEPPMPAPKTANRSRPRAIAFVLAIGMIGAVTPGVAQAHFTLDAPMSWMSQDVVGGPQKQSPCGDEGGGTATGAVTPFQAGETITIQWTEVVPHDGWFRIALSYNDRADLMDPPYELNAAGNSVDAGIENPPVAPVLVDGLFPHTAASIRTPKSYSYDLTLPTTPCDKCTLQVIQIMLNHPNNRPYGYTYHHCADISIQGGEEGGIASTDGGNPDAMAGASGSSGGASGAGGMGRSAHGSCAYVTGDPEGPAVVCVAALGAVAAFARRIRRRRSDD